MVAKSAMHDLATIMRRLEAVVSRLEDIGVSRDVISQAVLADDLPDSLIAFDTFVHSSVQPYVELSNQLGGLVSVQAKEVLKGFQEQRRFLKIADKAASPAPKILERLVKPTMDAILAVTEVQGSNRFDEQYTHLTAISDGIRMLAWVNIQNRPHSYVKDSLESAQYFGNKILAHMEVRAVLQETWIRSYYQLCRDLAEFVKMHYPAGITWDARGESADLVAGLH